MMPGSSHAERNRLRQMGLVGPRAVIGHQLVTAAAGTALRPRRT